MTNAGPADALARVRAALARSDDPRTDGQLLEAYRDRREPDAFTALVYRHGPSVLAVCQRVTRHDHDADDACQAVFLVLARRAADIRPPDAVGAWLYGVAFRTAQDARVMATRLRARQSPTADPPEASFETPRYDTESAAALDAEIAGLPEHYRAAVVLCELDGLDRRAAAKRLGIKEGTLSSRLAEARKRLAQGLKRRGFALPISLAAVLATGSSGSASVFPLACRLGHLAAAGEPLPAGAPVALADLVGKAMFLQKLKLVSLIVVCIAALGAGGWFARDRHATAADQPAEGPKVQPAKPAETKPLNKLVVWKQQKVCILDADGKNEKVLFELEKHESIREPRLSPDGKRVAYLTLTLDPAKPREPGLGQVHRVAIRELGHEAKVLKIQAEMIAWSPDGKELLATHAPEDNGGPRDPLPKATTWLIDAATLKETVLMLPGGHWAHAFTPDGKRVVTMFGDNSGKKLVMATCFVSRDGKDVQTVSDTAYATIYPQVSPNGKTLLFME